MVCSSVAFSQSCQLLTLRTAAAEVDPRVEWQCRAHLFHGMFSSASAAPLTASFVSAATTRLAAFLSFASFSLPLPCSK